MYLTEGFLNTYPVNVRGYCGILCLMLLLQPPISPKLAKLVLMLTEEVGNKNVTITPGWPCNKPDLTMKETTLYAAARWWHPESMAHTNIHDPLHFYSIPELPPTQLPVDNTINGITKKTTFVAKSWLWPFIYEINWTEFICQSVIPKDDWLANEFCSIYLTNKRLRRRFCHKRGLFLFPTSSFSIKTRLANVGLMGGCNNNMRHKILQ